MTLAKDATVTLSGGSYTNSASIFGPNRIEGGTFYGAVAMQDGSSVSSGSFLGAVTLSDTVVRNNGSNADGGSYLLSLSNCDAVAVRGCRFEDNALANFSDTSAGNLALAVENCTFEGNSFAAPNG